MNKVDIVIVNYNDAKNTIKLINELKNFKVINHIIVVDNNSNISDVSSIKQTNIKNLEVISTNENKGYSYALNKGCRYLIDKYGYSNVILSNSDISIKNEDIIIKLNNMINDKTKCVMPKIKENNTFKYGWKLTSPFIDLIRNIPLINRLYRDKLISYNKEYFNNNSIVDVIYGCFFMIDLKVLEEINYLDENTFLYYEENILAQKLKEKKYLSEINMDIYVSHLHNASIGSNINRLEKYKLYKQSELYYEKKYNKANVILIMFFRLFSFLNLIPYKIKALFH